MCLESVSGLSVNGSLIHRYMLVTVKYKMTSMIAESMSTTTNSCTWITLIVKSCFCKRSLCRHFLFRLYRTIFCSSNPTISPVLKWVSEWVCVCLCLRIEKSCFVSATHVNLLFHTSTSEALKEFRRFFFSSSSSHPIFICCVSARRPRYLYVSHSNIIL